MPLRSCILWTPCLSSCNICFNTSTIGKKMYGVEGHPCLDDFCSIPLLSHKTCSSLSRLVHFCNEQKPMWSIYVKSRASMVACKKDQETLSYAFSKFNNMITNSCLLSLAHAIAFMANNTLLKMVTLTKLVCERRIQFYMYSFILLAQSFKLTLAKILGGNWEAKFYAFLGK